MPTPDQRLAELGIVLPEPVAPLANYVPFVCTGHQLCISGQVSTDANGGIKGVVGVDIDLELARSAAQLCAINLIAQMRVALAGDLSRVRQIIRLGGFVQAGPDFYEIPQIINGASDLMVEVFGQAGRHARAAVGVYRLPANFAVEIDALVEVA